MVTYRKHVESTKTYDAINIMARLGLQGMFLPTPCGRTSTEWVKHPPVPSKHSPIAFGDHEKNTLIKLKTLGT